MVPSQTELLFDLGLRTEVVGITKFCVHPTEWFQTKPRVGGTKSIHINKVAALHPDLIIANKEENTKEQISALENIAPVWISDIRTMRDALRMIACIGEITGTDSKARAIIAQLNTDLGQLPSFHNMRTAYLIWKDPYMSVGRDTFIHDTMQMAGMHNVFGDEERYPLITIESLLLKQPELVLLSSEPYPFRQPHINELNARLPGARILLVDGEIFSWYGSRMLHLLPYLKGLVQQVFSMD